MNQPDRNAISGSADGESYGRLVGDYIFTATKKRNRWTGRTKWVITKFYTRELPENVEAPYHDEVGVVGYCTSEEGALEFLSRL